MTPLYIYLWGIADNVRMTAGTGCIVALVAYLLGWIFTFAEQVEPSRDGSQVAAAVDRLKKMAGRFCLFFGVIFMLFPTSNTLACMIVLPEIAASKPIQKDLPELYNIAIEALKKSLTPSK